MRIYCTCGHSHSEHRVDHVDVNRSRFACTVCGCAQFVDIEDVPDEDEDYLPQISPEEFMQPPDEEYVKALNEWEAHFNLPLASRKMSQAEIDDMIVAAYEVGVIVETATGDDFTHGPGKINAIKVCREQTGLGLKEAKDYVERLVGDGPYQFPKRL